MRISPNHRICLHGSWKKRLTLLSGLLTGIAAVWEIFMGSMPMWAWVMGGVMLPLSVAAIEVIEDDDGD